MCSQDFLLDVLRSNGIEPGSSSVLDIGTGNGKFSLELARMFKDVITIDSDGEAVRKINEKIADRKITNIKGIGNDQSMVNITINITMLQYFTYQLMNFLPSETTSSM